MTSASVAAHGDKTTTGGIISVERDLGFHLGDKPVAKIGDYASCPVCDAGGGDIVLERKESGMHLNDPEDGSNIQFAVNGDRVDCGCTDNYIVVDNQNMVIGF